jgi:NCAIR mutase (PurE)-related protein
VRDDIQFDWERPARTGVAEAVYCEGKTAPQIEAILTAGLEIDRALLLTRLSRDLLDHLSPTLAGRIDYDPLSRTGISEGDLPVVRVSAQIGIVAAGSSDLAVAREASRTLQYHGVSAPLIVDVGVAGLWRLTARLPEIRECDVLIVAAGMEGALFSVLGGLVSAPVIAVPTSIGYGVAADGRAALSSALASCAPGVVTVNIDNGFGAACAALKMATAHG